MRRYLQENWPEMVSDMAHGLQVGLMAAILTLIFFAVTDALTNTQAALTILRDLRGELRSAVGSKETEE